MRRSKRETKRNFPSEVNALDSQNEKKEKEKRKKVKREKKQEEEEMSHNKNTLTGQNSMSDAVVVGVDDTAVQRLDELMTEDANSQNVHVVNRSKGVEKSCCSLLSRKESSGQADNNNDETMESKKVVKDKLKQPRRRLQDMLIVDADKFAKVLQFHQKNYWNRRDFGGDNTTWMKGHTFSAVATLPLYASGDSNRSLNCMKCNRRCREVCLECSMLMLHSVAVCPYCKVDHVKLFPGGLFGEM